MWAREWSLKPNLTLSFRGSIPRGSTSGGGLENIDQSQAVCYNNSTSVKFGIGTISKQIKKSLRKERFFVCLDLSTYSLPLKIKTTSDSDEVVFVCEKLTYYDVNGG